MKRTPPVTDADRRQLSRAMLAVGEQVEAIWDELAAQGLDRPAAIARAAQEDLADRVSSRRGLRDYWREAAKEWLSALDSPIDILRGHYVAPYVYRSELIAALRSKAYLLPVSDTLPSPQIEPAIRAWAAMPFVPGSAKDQVVQAGQDALRQAAAASGEPERPGFAALDWRGRMALQRERYAQTLAGAGFTLAAPSRGFTLFQRATRDGKFVFNLIDDSGTGLASCMLRCQFALTWPGTRITSARLFAERLAAFYPEQVVPAFGYDCWFGRDSWPEFCVATDTIAALTLSLFRRLDEALQQDLPPRS